MRRTRRKAAKERVAKKRAAKKAARKKATKESRRPGPGEYLPDPTEGVTRPEDLPAPTIVEQSRNHRKHPCPGCGYAARRHKKVVRKLHDLGDVTAGRPRDIRLTVSQHCCPKCARYFYADTSDIAPHNAQYTDRVGVMAVRLVVEDGLPYRAASWHMWRDHRVFVPFATIQNWVEASGKKGRRARCG
jgi:hypothetical protein